MNVLRKNLSAGISDSGEWYLSMLKEITGYDGPVYQMVVQIVNDMMESAKTPEKSPLDRTLEILAESDLSNLAGFFVDVDTLQEAMQIAGFRKGSVGRDHLWYRNIISTPGGYTAELEAVLPGGQQKITVVISRSINDDPMILGYELKPRQVV